MIEIRKFIKALLTYLEPAHRTVHCVYKKYIKRTETFIHAD